jgi:hypothetical protein
MGDGEGRRVFDAYLRIGATVSPNIQHLDVIVECAGPSGLLETQRLQGYGLLRQAAREEEGSRKLLHCLLRRRAPTHVILTSGTHLLSTV